MSTRKSKKLIGAKVTINPLYANLIRQTSTIPQDGNTEFFTTTSNNSLLDSQKANQPRLSYEANSDTLSINITSESMKKKPRKRKCVTNNSVQVNPNFLKMSEAISQRLFNYN
jgi:hypothetical protein